MKNLYKFFILSLIGVFIPYITFAFSLNAAGTTIGTVIKEVTDILNLLLPILSGLAFIFFFWGLSKFILASDKPEEIKNGRTYMLWGILALFVLVTYRIIVSLISNELEIGNSKDYPKIPIVSYYTSKIVE